MNVTAKPYVTIDEGYWVLFYTNKEGKPDSHRLELEWWQDQASDARKAACEYLDVPLGEVNVNFAF